MDISHTRYASKYWFFFTVLFIVFDYTRIYNELSLGVVQPLMILILILGYFIVSSGEYQFAKNRQMICFGLFILLLACYVPFAQNNNYAYKTVKAMLLYLPFTISVICCVNSFARLKKFILILILIEVYIAFYGFTHAGYGPGNYFLDENDLSLYLNMWIPFCYFLFFAYSSKTAKAVCLAGLIIGLLAVIVSFSRGGFIGIVVTGGVIWLFSKRKILSLLIIFFMVGLMLLYAGPEYWNEMATATDAEGGTGRARIESWKSGWRMFLDNPLGVGGNNFQVRFPEYQTDWFKRGMWGRVAHSLWFTLIPELGIFGICIYMSLLYYNIKDIFWLKNISFAKDEHEEKFLNYTGRAFVCSLCGYFASGTFLSVLYYAHYWYLIGLIVASVNIAKAYFNPQLQVNYN